MLDDPIVALATPPGRAALAVVRASGCGVLELAARVIEGFSADPARTARLATFLAADGTPIDRGLYLTWRAPASYTGEDGVECFCHGGLVVPARLVAAFEAAGARLAAPGEFTRRAVLNGRMDLVQAEAVGDLIDATAPQQARAALARLEGGLSRRLATLRTELVELLALLSYAIDFPEEDDGPLDPGRARDALAAVRTALGRLLATAPAGERLRAGALVALAGAPNAGKSSLFNALLGTDRAIVTELPGTTRDVIEAATSISGWPVRLVDTAGLRTDGDRIEHLGMAQGRRWLAAADLVLWCTDPATAPDAAPTDLSADRILFVSTKADLAPGPTGTLAVSAVTGEGLDALMTAVVDRLFGEGVVPAELDALLANERHRLALGRAHDALDQGARQLADGGDPVLAAHHVQEAVHALETLIGAVDADEVLGVLFAGFCIGK